MADDLSSLLSWFANYSNYYSVLTILLCFITMVIFILRLNNENMFLNTSSTQQINLAVEKAVTDLHNPFSIEINSNKQSSLANGLHIKLSILEKCILHVCWGIDLETFHMALQEPWQHILSRLHRNSWLDGTILAREENQEIMPGRNIEQHIQCPLALTAEVLGTTPRRKYPAMVIISLLDQQTNADSCGPKIVAVFSIIHMKDNICQLDSHIIGQYLKTNTDHVCTLQPLYVSTSPDLPVDAEIPTQQSTSTANQNVNMDTVTSDEDSLCTLNDRSQVPSADSTNMISVSEQCDECIVCQSAQVTFALLPCRHACVCELCLKQMERCPMCRGFIDSFFRIKDCAYRRASVEDDSDIPLQSESWWERSNRRLNEFLGFT